MMFAALARVYPKNGPSRLRFQIVRLGALAAFLFVMAAAFYSASSASSLRQVSQATLTSSDTTHSVNLAGADNALLTHARNTLVASVPSGSMLAFLPQNTAPGSESIATFASDCVTPKTDFNLGETICAEVANAPSSSTRVTRRIDLVDPASLLENSINVVLGSSTQTTTFALPLSPTSSSFGGTIDNRGTWNVNLTDTSDASVRASAQITVHDPARSVADLEVSKFRADSSQGTAGAPIQSIIWVFNGGPDAAQNVNFTDVPPPNTTFQSLTQISGPIFTCTTPGSGSTGTSTCDRTTLNKDQGAGFVVTYQVNSGVSNGTAVTDSISVSSDTFDRNSADNASTSTTQLSNPTQPSCTITCPGNITAPANMVNATGQGGAIVNFNEPTTTGTCGSTTSLPTSGSFFAIGSSVVTTTTESGQSCSFTVTVTDGQAPTISCPPNITVNESSPGSGSATVKYNVTATDNSGSATVDCDKASGSSFNSGTTTVHCTATDNSNNATTCSFDVTVNVANATCTLTPPASPIVVESPANACGSNITFDVGETGSCATVTCDHASGSFFHVGDTPVTCTSSADRTSTSFMVTVKDASAPVPSVSTLPTVTKSCTATVDAPTAVDNCGGTIGGSTTDRRTYDVPGTYTVNWTYTDEAGNTSTQTQTVVVTADTTAPVPDVAILPSITAECSATVTVIPTATDDCSGAEIAGTTTDPLSYSGAGTYTVHWTYSDASGNSRQQNQTVVVTDTVAPNVTLVGASSITVECHTRFDDPGVITDDNCQPKVVNVTTSGSPNVNTPGTYVITYTATDGGGNHSAVQRTVIVSDRIAPVITLNSAATMTVECHTSFADPGGSASDSCDSSVPVTVSGSVNVNTPGTYVLTYNAMDDSGNAAAPVTRTITVVDTTAPTISCPKNLVAYLPLNSTATAMAVSYPAVTASDSCSSATATSSPASGSVFPVGTTVVNATATDSAGNRSTCSFTVTVLYNFTGFFSPVNNQPTFNVVNAGRAIPVKFSLSGNKGLSIFPVDSPQSGLISCDASAPATDLTDTTAAGNSSLSYDAGSDQYNYVWKTESSWAGTCRQLRFTLKDGSVHVANFKFK